MIIDERRMYASLISEAARLWLNYQKFMEDWGWDAQDLASIGALKYVQLMENVPEAVKFPHAWAMRRCVGVMLDAIRNEREVKSHEIPMGTVDFPDSPPAERHGTTYTNGPSLGILSVPRYVRRAIGKLTPNEQQAIRLMLRGYGDKEIARALGVSENAAALRKHHAKRKLRARLGERWRLLYQGEDEDAIVG